MEIPSPHLRRRGKPEASGGGGEAGPPGQQERGSRRRRVGTRGHMLLRGSDTEASLRTVAAKAKISALHVLMRGLIARTHRLAAHLPIPLVPGENQ